MFLGHYGLAFAAKRVVPRTSLGALTFASEFLDELWPILLLLGVEQVKIVPALIRRHSSTIPSERFPRSVSPLDFVYYPYSHSLLMAIVWGALIGVVYYLLRRYRRGAWVMAVLVMSHWFLDLPMHRWDLPLWPGASSPKFGWGLWDSIVATYVIEFAIFAIGIVIYLRATRARDRVGSWGLWVYIVVLALIYVMSNASPPPPSERAVAWSALGLWLFVPWVWWVDRHRMPVSLIERI